MKLYYFETPNGRKVCAAAKYLNSFVEFVRVDLAKGEQKRPEFLAINPNGKIPALVDGDMKLWESNAIMCYLAEKAKSDLWPRDGRQIDVIRWLSWDGEHFNRHGGTLYFENIIKVHFLGGEPDPAVIAETTGYFKQLAGVLDNHLKGRDALVGGALTVADFAVASVLPYAKEARLPLDGFAEIRRWYAGLTALLAWREPFPTKAPAAAA